MFFLLAGLLISSSITSSPLIENPKPLQPQHLNVEGDRVLWENDQWRIRLTSLTPDHFRRYLLKAGISQTTLDNPAVIRALTDLAPFHVLIHNKGEANLTFNPDQVILKGKRLPTGYLIDAAAFWPSQLPHSSKEQERLATLFTRSSVELEPGRNLVQLIVFKPVRDRFEKNVTLQINRMYYGIDPFDIHCQYEIRYPKQ